MKEEEKMEDLMVRIQEWLTFYGIKAIAALLILIIGRWIARGLRGLITRAMTKKELDPVIISFTASLCYVALIVFVVIAAIAQLGVQTTSFIAVIGAAGLAIGLALQGSLANFAAGFLIVIFRPFKIDDYVTLAGISGTVEEVLMFSTQLKTLDNKTIIIPNGKIMGDIIVNFTRKETRRVDIIFGVSYAEDIDSVREIFTSITDSDSRILKDPQPAIIVKELADSSVNFELRAWVNTADYWDVYFNTIETVKKHFDKKGVTIPFPQRDIHIFQQNPIGGH